MTDNSNTGNNDLEESNIPFSELPSLDIGIEEVRRRYDQEARRSTIIETKASALLGLNAIIISVVTAAISVFQYFGVIVVVLAICSSLQTLRTLRIHKYKRPLKQARNISRYMAMENDESSSKIVELYIKASEYNAMVNNKRYSNYKLSFYLTGAAVFLIVIAPVFTVRPELIECVGSSACQDLFNSSRYN